MSVLFMRRTFATAGVTAENSDEIFDSLVDELEALEESNEALQEATVTFELDQDRVAFEVYVDAPDGDYEAAEIVAMSCIRSALHASGGGTPGWEDYFQLSHTESTVTAV
ncbi:hypothetical protein [Sediminivirga luteola]|uniref:Uncharacterized protein n=1 Tax=Sediminivirga luteola TaxID=1774748 RepID=A0A8J2TWC1_9MICO|nr:hypothetical protein [Sediminivirga luteola]GGA08006.1 hypothetical protein GCM10011333_08520 [Sediminivirga luteola]